VVLPPEPVVPPAPVVLPLLPVLMLPLPVPVALVLPEAPEGVVVLPLVAPAPIPPFMGVFVSDEPVPVPLIALLLSALMLPPASEPEPLEDMLPLVLPPALPLVLPSLLPLLPQDAKSVVLNASEARARESFFVDIKRR